ncbi:MAG: anhydro-N-acetylmuramic acid kinase [Planctomycetes bacterium]|nr:anhydro-N-acetylmuramic acid kinase [Planctomycetota bacterium]
MEPLRAISSKSRRLVAGILSGTSADAIDCAICSIEGAGPPRDLQTGEPRVPAVVRLEAFRSQPFDPELRRRILDAQNANTASLAALHVDLGIAFADALLRTLVLSGIPEEAIDLVGSHGQTVFHHSGAGPKVTLQIGDGDQIAERTGFPVISDFRARDIAAGGEGAPLTPYADAVLYTSFPSRDEAAARIILNLGGIGNITILNSDPRKIVAFDTGPANAPLDRLARIFTNGARTFDEDGAIAASGAVDAEILDELMDHPFLRKTPPKSTGTEVFGDAFVADLCARRGPVTPDLMATVTRFVAESVRVAILQFGELDSGLAHAEIVVAGGGARNRALMTCLLQCLGPARVVTSDERGVPSHAREAMAFAILANDALAGLPTNLPRVTGARRAVTLGKLSFPRPA